MLRRTGAEGSAGRGQGQELGARHIHILVRHWLDVARHLHLLLAHHWLDRAKHLHLLVHQWLDGAKHLHLLVHQWLD